MSCFGSILNNVSKLYWVDVDLWEYESILDNIIYFSDFQLR